MANVTFLTEETAIVRAIAGIKRTGKKLDDQVDMVAKSICIIGHMNGDIKVIEKTVNSLIDAMPKGARVNALREFILKFAPVNWNKKKEVYVYAKGKRIAGTDANGVVDMATIEASELYQAMAATTWTEYKKPSEYKGYDLNKKFASFLKSAVNTKAESKDATKDSINDAFLAELQALAARHNIDLS